MSCTNCGSSSPCSCSQQINTAVGRTCVTSCGCGNSSCSGCGCNAAIPATPLPFYACAPVCPENHKQTVVVQNFYYDIAAQNTWNVPTCGATAVLYVPGVKSIAIGAYIWSSEFGYFEVTAFDASSNQVTVKNNCNEDNAAPGTNVPACSKFTVTDPPQEDSPTSSTCIAVDFTAPPVVPAVGSCIPITLTDLDSIQVADLIQIGAGRYRVESIDGPDTITICNDGLGLVPGTAVIALNGAGDYQYCITVVSTCCERILDEFGGDLTPCSDFENDLSNPDVTGDLVAGPTTIGDGEFLDSDSIVLSFENESTCRTMQGIVAVSTKFELAEDGTSGTNILTFSLLQSINGAPPTTVYTNTDAWAAAAVAQNSYARDFNYPTTVAVAAGTTVTLAYTFRIALQASGDGEAIISNLLIRGVGLGVAV